MKPLLLILLVSIMSCEQYVPPTEQSSLDTLLKKTQASLDSGYAQLHTAIDYLGKNHAFARKADSVYILYLKTGKEKYLTLRDQYADSTNHYSQLLNNIKTK